MPATTGGSPSSTARSSEMRDGGTGRLRSFIGLNFCAFRASFLSSGPVWQGELQVCASVSRAILPSFRRTADSAFSPSIAGLHSSL